MATGAFVGRRTPIASATLLAAVLMSPVLGAQPCKDLRPAPGNLGYRLRWSNERGNYRCEGLYLAPAAGEPIEVVSYFRTRGPLPRGRPDLVLEVVPPHIGPAYRGARMSIVALSKVLGIYYRMKAEIAIEDKLRWPVGEVLPAALYPDGFGLLASVETAERHRLFLPVTLQIEGAPAANPVGEPLLLVRPGQYLAQLAWRARPRQVSPPPSWVDLGPVPAGRTVRLALPTEASADEDRRIVVDISSQGTDGRPLSTVPVHVVLP